MTKRKKQKIRIVRTLKISSLYVQRRWGDNKIVPSIRLNGLWLKEAGFDVDDKIEVVVSQKCLLITNELSEEDN